jgi:hypothetical protein
VEGGEEALVQRRERENLGRFLYYVGQHDSSALSLSTEDIAPLHSGNPIITNVG